MHQIPDGRLLPGNFMTINHGFAIALGKEAANAFLQNFVQDLIASGFVAESIEKHQIKGLIAIQK
jgi:polar amino acid transport system substrate-binding protein